MENCSIKQSHITLSKLQSSSCIQFIKIGPLICAPRNLTIFQKDVRIVQMQQFTVCARYLYLLQVACNSWNVQMVSILNSISHMWNGSQNQPIYKDRSYNEDSHCRFLPNTGSLCRLPTKKSIICQSSKHALPSWFPRKSMYGVFCILKLHFCVPTTISASD